jgi:hypothetical protein
MLESTFVFAQSCIHPQHHECYATAPWCANARLLYLASQTYSTHARKPSLDSHRTSPFPISRPPTVYRANTFTTPSPPALTTRRPSGLHATSQTPSPRIARWETISCVQMRFSSDQNRMLASWPADTASLPSLDNDKEEIAEGCASMVYVA